MPSDGGEKIKETVLLSLLHVALPTIDVYTDLALIVRFYTRNIDIDIDIVDIVAL